MDNAAKVTYALRDLQKGAIFEVIRTDKIEGIYSLGQGVGARPLSSPTESTCVLPFSKT